MNPGDREWLAGELAHDLASGLRWRLWGGAGHPRHCPCTGCEHARQSIARYQEWSHEAPVDSPNDRSSGDTTDGIAIQETPDIVSLAAEAVRAGMAVTSHLILSGPRTLGASIKRAHQPVPPPAHPPRQRHAS